MAEGFSPEILDEVRARLDIVDVVSDHVALKKGGENWKGLCPFHAEKTPSFMVNPKKGIFHCFGCGAGGDIFSFVMKIDRLTFPEAVRSLAQRAGAALPEVRRRQDPGQGGREALYKVLKLAADFYYHTLWEERVGGQARDYLQRRGIEEETAHRFVLGYAPEGWDSLLSHAAGQGISTDALLQAGLVLQRQTGSGYYDRFRGRLIFPISDVSGRPIAFGGRALGAEEPKYLNSPETPVYVKGQILYALHLAKERIREANRAIVVEGYIDCLMAHQYGFTETVAPLGTAFTQAQSGLLKRYADELITVFDADTAGAAASLRGLDALLESGLWVRVALLPEGEDPDTFLRAQGAGGFTACVGGAQPLLLRVLEQILPPDPRSLEGRLTVLRAMAPLLAKLPDTAERRVYAEEVGRRTGLDGSAVLEEIVRFKKQAGKVRPPKGESPQESSEPPLFERLLVKFVLQDDIVRDALLPQLEAEDINHPDLKVILETVKSGFSEGDIQPASILNRLGSEEQRGLFTRLLMEPLIWDDRDLFIEQNRKRLIIKRKKRRARQIIPAIAQADSLDARKLQQEVQAAAQEIHELVRSPQVDQP